jgi:hypothetical protein
MADAQAGDSPMVNELTQSRQHGWRRADKTVK